eukprot:2083580-Amphidinium_carterae.1
MFRCLLSKSDQVWGDLWQTLALSCVLLPFECHLISQVSENDLRFLAQKHMEARSLQSCQSIACSSFTGITSKVTVENQ